MGNRQGAIGIDIAVFTDLDGTLLDHNSYSFEAAMPALQALAARKAPVYLNSSKTVAELLELASALVLGTPMIAENGAAVIAAGGEVLREFGLPRHNILRELRRLRSASGYRFRGFADMSITEIASLTGLSSAAAARAADKRWSEPVVWLDSEARLSEFGEQLQGVGLALTRGGRFLHVSSQVDKGQAMQWLHASECPNAVLIALGDGENDRSMLELADIPVVVRSPVHAPLQLNHLRAITTDELGPAGWNRAILDLLDSL